ncbi:hypothetical protein E2C01_074713 [Portunus trituberculatus]|uniref:Uncharacterized protein n=1 Tax=Portunus trituberculatus TaxID=210409 RepID=A0A5B7IHY2_PORTR|nr:hypothetical protein [Portunus trituberculatus]
MVKTQARCKQTSRRRYSQDLTTHKPQALPAVFFTMIKLDRERPYPTTLAFPPTPSSRNNVVLLTHFLSRPSSLPNKQD